MAQERSLKILLNIVGKSKGLDKLIAQLNLLGKTATSLSKQFETINKSTDKSFNSVSKSVNSSTNSISKNASSSFNQVASSATAAGKATFNLISGALNFGLIAKDTKPAEAMNQLNFQLKGVNMQLQQIGGKSVVLDNLTGKTVSTSSAMKMLAQTNAEVNKMLAGLTATQRASGLDLLSRAAERLGKTLNQTAIAASQAGISISSMGKNGATFFKTANRQAVSLNQTVRTVKANAHKFSYEWLGIMFAAMAANRVVMRFLRSSIQTYEKVTKKQGEFTKQTNRLSAAWEFFKFRLIDALGQSAMFKKVIDWVVRFIDKASRLSPETMEKIAVAALIIAGATGAAMVIGQIALALGAIKGLISKLVLNGLPSMMRLLGLTGATGVLTFALIAAAVAAFVIFAAKNFEQIKGIWSDTAKAMRLAWEGDWSEMVKYLGSAAIRMGHLIQEFWVWLIKLALQGVARLGTIIVGGIVDAVGAASSKAADMLEGLPFVGDAFKKFHDVQKKYMGLSSKEGNEWAEKWRDNIIYAGKEASKGTNNLFKDFQEYNRDMEKEFREAAGIQDELVENTEDFSDKMCMTPSPDLDISKTLGIKDSPLDGLINQSKKTKGAAEETKSNLGSMGEYAKIFGEKVDEIFSDASLTTASKSKEMENSIVTATNNAKQQVDNLGVAFDGTEQSIQDVSNSVEESSEIVKNTLLEQVKTLNQNLSSSAGHAEKIKSSMVMAKDSILAINQAGGMKIQEPELINKVNTSILSLSGSINSTFIPSIQRLNAISLIYIQVMQTLNFNLLTFGKLTDSDTKLSDGLNTILNTMGTTTIPLLSDSIKTNSERLDYNAGKFNSAATAARNYAAALAAVRREKSRGGHA